MTQTIHVRADRASVLAAALSLPAVCSGRQPGGGAAQKALLVRLGLQTLLTVADAFAVKSAGGTDESGLRWRRLRPLTVKLKKHREGRPKTAILRDDDLLSASLEPGAPPAAAGATPPRATGLQVFRLGRGAVTVGTRRKHAGRHHRGDPAHRLPQRRLWPAPAGWPARWWDGLARQASAGVIGVLKHMLGEL